MTPETACWLNGLADNTSITSLDFGGLNFVGGRTEEICMVALASRAVQLQSVSIARQTVNIRDALAIMLRPDSALCSLRYDRADGPAAFLQIVARSRLDCLDLTLPTNLDSAISSQ